MNRLVALVAVSSLGTGCVSSSRCDFRTFTIEWPMFELAGGSVVTSCADAGARTVNVYGDGGLVTSSACTDGSVDIDVPAGDHQVVVEALDASGTRIILRDEFLTGGRGCGPEDVVVEPAAGNFLLDYSFTPVNVCTAGGSYIWFKVLDQTANVTAVEVDESSANPQLYACGAAVSLSLPKGPYTLLRTEEASGSGGTYSADATNCTPADFSIAAGAPTTVSPSLSDSSTFCP